MWEIFQDEMGNKNKIWLKVFYDVWKIFQDEMCLTLTHKANSLQVGLQSSSGWQSQQVFQRHTGKPSSL